MNARLLFPCAVISVLIMPIALTAQYPVRDGSVTNIEPYLFAADVGWALGEPDLVLRSTDVTMPAVGPDRWGDIGFVPTGLTEDRYVKSVEVREVNDIPTDVEVTTVGGRYIMTIYEGSVEWLDPVLDEAYQVRPSGRVGQ
jgi:hypothetical protein